MARDKKLDPKPIEQYAHTDKTRVNNPPIGLVTPETDVDTPAAQYAYDPHLDPSLHWAGKAERLTFEIPTVSLHVHERLDPRTIIKAVQTRRRPTTEQMSLFATPAENPAIDKAIEFYRHSHNWSNRLMAGDSLLVMNSLLQKEGLAGKVQMVYLDPPYGIKYGSNFQPFVHKRDVKDGKDDDLTREPEMLKAFRDTWELGIHSYLTYLRDRLLLAKELLTESGSVFVQIGDENVHLVRSVLDDVFGSENFCGQIHFQSTTSQTSKLLPTIGDYVLWYAKDIEQVKYRQLYSEKQIDEPSNTRKYAQFEDGSRKTLTQDERTIFQELPGSPRLYVLDNLTSQSGGETTNFLVSFQGQSFSSGKGFWKTNVIGMERLRVANRLGISGNTLRYVRFVDDFPVSPVTLLWTDTMTGSFTAPKVYVVQTNTKIIERCMLMTTDPGELVFDPTCGSGTTAYVAEQWGRRWITCDTSRVALTLAKQRLLTAVFDYYELQRPDEGVSSGFRYKTVPHITLKSIANNDELERIYAAYQPKIAECDPECAGSACVDAQAELAHSRREMQQKMDASIQRHAPPETLYDQPVLDKKKVRVTGPFTMEAVPAPTVLECAPECKGSAFAAQAELAHSDANANVERSHSDLARSGETLRQAEWRAELLKTGIRGKGGQKITFARVEPLAGTRYLHAEAETNPSLAPSPELTPPPPSPNLGEGRGGVRTVISFGPAFAPLAKKQVEHALEEAYQLVPRPKLLVFAAFQFDALAARDIEQATLPGVTLLKAQMNADLLTADLKKQRASNESFWLIGQPDVRLTEYDSECEGSAFADANVERSHSGLWRVELFGFDYYNVLTGNIESGGVENIAVWLLDPDYDGRSLFPRQVFFPMSGEKDGWSRLAKTLKAEIDEELIEFYRGTVSLPFELGEHSRVAVKIVDDRGIESVKVIEVI